MAKKLQISTPTTCQVERRLHGRSVQAGPLYRLFSIFVTTCLFVAGLGLAPSFAERLIVPLGKTAVVKASRPKKVMAVKEGVVSIFEINDQEITLMGVGTVPGSTQLFVYDDEGKKIYDIQTYSEQELTKQKFDALLGDSNVTVNFFPDVVYLKGVVNSQDKKEKAEKIINGLAPDQKIENLLEVKIQPTISLKERIEEAIKIPTVKISVIKPNEAPWETPTATDTANVTVIAEGYVENQNDFQHLSEVLKGFIPAEGNVRNLVSIKNPIQVVFQAYILEMTRDATKDLGIKWGTSPSVGGGLTPGGVVNFYENVTNAWRGDVQSLGAPVPSHVNPFAGGNLNRFEIIDAQVSALEKTGKAKVLANPKLIVYANAKLSKLAQSGWLGEGDQEPGKLGVAGTNPESDSGLAFFETSIKSHFISGTDNQGKPQFDQDTAKLRLAIRDLFVIGEDGLKFSVFAQQGELVSGRTTTLDKSDRSVMTTAKIKNGETMVLGGLIKKNNTVNSENVPILSKIPYLGRFFRWKHEVLSESELVILLTPEIVGREKDHMGGKKVEIVPVPKRTEHLEKLHNLFQKIKSSHFPEETAR